MPLRDEPPGWCLNEEVNRTNVRVIPITMTDGLLWATIWNPATIYISNALAPAQARCIATRELLRLRWGRPPDVSPPALARRDKALMEQSARLLIPIDALVHSISRASTSREQADLLCVDQETLKVRLEGLSEEEWSAVTAIVDVVGV